MRVAKILILLFVCSKTEAQESSIISVKLNQIEKIPCTYNRKSISEKQSYDKAFNFILALDTFAIPSLIDLLTDTTKSKVKFLGTNEYYKKGDLAFVLINYIEGVPLASVSELQWCICCDCGNLPTDFLQYLNINRFGFQKKYKSFYTSQERQKMIKQNPKWLKKNRSR